MGKFQMIKPYPTDKIYESSNVNKCAKKFYDILKSDLKSDKISYDYFILKNLDDNSYYKFQIKQNHNCNMIGGQQNEQKNNSSQNNNSQNNNQITKRIDKLEERVLNLENREKKENDNLNKEQNKDLYKEHKRGLIPPPENNKDMCIIS